MLPRTTLPNQWLSMPHVVIEIAADPTTALARPMGKNGADDRQGFDKALESWRSI
jgi:hypothetical protein